MEKKSELRHAVLEKLHARILYYYSITILNVKTFVNPVTTYGAIKGSSKKCAISYKNNSWNK